MIITEAQLKQSIPYNNELSEWVKLLNIWLPKYNINTKERIACFLGQTGHESGDFLKLSENLNYSVNGLMMVFPKYFPTVTLANQYARQPEKIANKVYANRMGNLGEASGDGWRYRGRGLIGLTGKNAYNNFSLECGKTLAETVAYLQTKEGALHAALWFWKVNNLNVYADKLDVKKITLIVNGGSNGISDRLTRTTRTLKAL